MNILILSSSEGISIGLLRCLSLQNAKGFVLSVWSTSQAAKLSRYCSGYLSCPLSESQPELSELIGKVDAYCRENKIDLIMPAGILGTFILAKIKEQLSCAKIFPMPSAEQVRSLHNKWQFHQLLMKHKIPAPDTFLVEHAEQLQALPIAFPAMVKPLALGNGEGVHRIDSLKELINYQASANGSRARRLPLLVQEFIPGADIVFGIVANEGKLLAWTMHERKPDWLRFFRDDAILEMGQKFVAEYNFSGAANFDLRVDENTGRIAFIECNPRFWASTPLSVYYGVDMLNIGIQAALGRALPAHCKTGVDRLEEVPYPTPRRFLRGILTGDYSMRRFKRDFAWQALIDPLPTIKDLIWDRLHLINLYDSALIEQMS